MLFEISIPKKLTGKEEDVMATKERREYEKYHEKFESEYHDFLGGVKDKYRTEWGTDTTSAYKEAYERDKYLRKKAFDSEQREYDNQNLQRGMSDYRNSNGSFQEEKPIGCFGYLVIVGVFIVACLILCIVLFVKDNLQFTLWFVSPFIMLVILIKKKIFYWIERIGFFMGMLVCCWSQSFAVAIRSNGGIANDGPNLIIGILNLISFIACMFLFLAMGVPRLRKLYKRYFDPLRKEIKTKQSGIEYDPDSSPKAFEHYKSVYTFDHCPLMDEFDWLNVNTRNHLLNENYENAFERLYIKIKNNTMGLGDSFLLGGETDFNFNEQKFFYLMQILRQEKVRHKDFEKLQFCNKNYHSVVNFSLMPATGAMGNFKGSEKFDRLDCFICSLNEFYTNGNYQVLSEAKGKNREYLLNYLSLFDDIYDYCRKIYFIEEREFVDRIITNGQKPLESREDVVRYMNLATAYWDVKEQYFKKKLSSDKGR